MAKTLDQINFGVPQMGETLKGWFQSMTFIKLVKTVVNFENFETEEEIKFRGVWQPASAESLMLKPEGQRSWRWYTVHAEKTLILNPDEIILYRGQRYRVKDKNDYFEYGYIQYGLIEDYIE